MSALSQIRIALANYVMEPDIKRSEISLSSADILALSTSPVIKAINKPGDASKYNVPISIEFIYTAGTTPYTRNSSAAMILSYEGTTTINMTLVGSLLTQSVSGSTRAIDSGTNANVPLTSSLNKDIYLILNGGSFTLGNGTLKIKILYHTVTI